MSEYFNPVEVIKTDDWLSILKTKIIEFNMESPLFVTSIGTKKRLDLDLLFSENYIYEDVKPNPDINDCNKIIKFCKNKNIDGIIAIGGGSAMDLAKVILANLCLEQDDIMELISFKEENYQKKIPSIFIPTTHGTGSEVTMWGTIWDMDLNKKYSISHIELYPNVAILDGKLTLSLPLEISIITVLDALSHSFEAIWNKNSNSKSTEYAIKSISIILKNISSFKKQYTDVNLRNKLLFASTIAGMAFSNTKTAAAHSISYPLTIFYDIPHGIASSISLLPLLDINKDYIKDSINKICLKNKLTYSQLINIIKSIPQDIVLYKLSDWGIRKENLNQLVDASFTKGRMDNNIVDLNSSDVKEILKSIL